MKLSMIGAGLRTPLLLNGLIRNQAILPVDEVVLYDTHPERLATMGEFARRLCSLWQGRFELEVAQDPRAAVAGATFVVSAVRVGCEGGRIVDEAVPFRYGVLGQETTGPGGFAMALRTIPVVLDYARIIEEVAPHAWLINFTNPAGMVTQALTATTRVRAVGICDTPQSVKRSLARFLGVRPREVFLDYFGLNHLGWIRRVVVHDEDRLPYLLARYEDLQAEERHWRLFEPDLVRTLGMLPTEYLYYFYYRDRAVESILRSGGTRGGQVEALNRSLWATIAERMEADDLPGALRGYEEGLQSRELSYMAREQGFDSGAAQTRGPPPFESEGYEGLALALMKALTNSDRQTLILNVENHGAIPGMHDGDVVEVPCSVDASGPHPLLQAPIPEAVRGLVETVKSYERLTVEAAISVSRAAALQALSGHPLVASYSLARAILDDYLREHARWLPAWQAATRAQP